jgi:hypothetical protein
VREKSTQANARLVAEIDPLIKRIDDKDTADLFVFDEQGNISSSSTGEERNFVADFQNVNFASTGSIPP